MKNREPKIVMSEKTFPQSDPNAYWTAVIDGVPRYEYSRRDQSLWERPYGAPRSEPFRPIMGNTDLYLLMNYSGLRELCRKFARSSWQMEGKE